VAFSAEHRNLSQSNLVTEPTENTVSEPVVEGATHLQQALTVRQFATLHAVLERLIHQPEAHLAARFDADLANGGGALITPRSRAYPAALDALDTLARTHTHYAFADLTPELQDVIIDFIASGRLTAKYPNLAPWLEDLRAAATQSLAA
jgi:hypothetical protein